MHKDVKGGADCRIPRKRLARLFETVLRGEKLLRFASTVNLVFTGDRRMRALNREYRNLDKTTDVLSFNIDTVDQRDGTFGEVYISVPVARRQAKSYNHSPSTEYLRLFCHGLLHLCGHDHENPGEAETMLARENRYLGRALKG